jgi:hypothetical protein
MSDPSLPKRCQAPRDVRQVGRPSSRRAGGLRCQSRGLCAPVHGWVEWLRPRTTIPEPSYQRHHDKSHGGYGDHGVETAPHSNVATDPAIVHGTDGGAALSKSRGVTNRGGARLST